MLGNPLNMSTHLRLFTPENMDSRCGGTSSPLSSVHSIPTPKTPTRQTRRAELSRDDRIRVQTLHRYANWTYGQIAAKLDISYRQVQYAATNPVTPQKRKCGQSTKITSPRKRVLTEYINGSPSRGQLSWDQIPAALGWNDVGAEAVRTALESEGYHRVQSQTREV